jgi:hypothetical protein
MVQPRFVGAGKQSERAQQAMRGYDARVAARVAIRTSKWQSASGFSRLQVTIEGMIEALKVFKGEVAESKDQLPSACREPEKGCGRGGRGNASGSGEQGAVQQPGLSELTAELARSAVGPGGSAGGVDKTPWSFLWKIVPDFATGAGEAAVTSDFGRRARIGHLGVEAEDQALASGSVPSPGESSGDGHTVGSEAVPETGQTAGSEAGPETSPARDAPSGPGLPPSDGQTAGGEAEPEPGTARDAPSGLAPPPGDGHSRCR